MSKKSDLQTLCPKCLEEGRRTSLGKNPRLAKGVYCMICGFKLQTIEKHDRSEATKRAWITRKQRYGNSGMRSTQYHDEELFL